MLALKTRLGAWTNNRKMRFTKSSSQETSTVHGQFIWKTEQHYAYFRH